MEFFQVAGTFLIGAVMGWLLAKRPQRPVNVIYYQAGNPIAKAAAEKFAAEIGGAIVVPQDENGFIPKDENGLPDHWPCKRPPPGWKCSRAAGHNGPCAARRDEE